jgi:hypothetical protein
MLQLDPTLKRTLRDNKNTRLPILIVLLYQSCGPTPRATPAPEICAELNLNRDTVNDALQAMAHDGYVARTEYGWIATSSAQQLPLTGLITNGIETQQSGLLPEATGQNTMRKLSASVRSFSASPVVVVDQQDSNSENQQQQTNNAAKAETFRDDVRAALQSSGIRPGKQHRTLMADEWVTADRIRRWQSEVQRMLDSGEAAFGNPAGYIITRLLAHDEPPEHAPAEKRLSAYRSDRELYDLQINNPNSMAYRLAHRSVPIDEEDEDAQPD